MNALVDAGEATEAARPPRRLAPLVHQACGHLARSVRWTVLLLTVAMLAALTFQVVMRYVFGRASSWSEELAVTCFSWSMLLAIALGVRDGIHARMDLLLDRLPKPLQVGLEKAISLGIAFTGLFIAWAGARYVADSTGVVSAAIGYPITLLYACAPVSGALIAVFGLEHLFGGR